MTTTTDPWAEPTESPPDMGEPPKEATNEEPAAESPPATPEPAKKASPPAKKATAAAPTKAVAPKPGPTTAPPAFTGMGSVLAEQTTYVTELIYGPEGTGKTTDGLRMTRLAGENQRVMLIDAEAGAKIQALKQRGVDVSKVEVWPKPEDGGPSALTFEGLYDLADHLAKYSEYYVGWMWDSGSEITRRLLDQVTSEARVKDERLGKARGRFQVNLEDHGVASAMLRELLRKYRDLPMHGVITALERRDIDNDTGRVRYGPAMSPAMANDAAGLVDIVAFKTVDTVGGEEVRSANFVPTTIRRAKDRFGVLPKKLADPYFDRIVGYVHGEITRENDPVQARVRELAQAAAAPAGAATNKKES